MNLKLHLGVFLTGCSLLMASCQQTSDLDEVIEIDSFENSIVRSETEPTASVNSLGDYKPLVYHHAPVHIQDVDQTGRYSLGGVSDYVTAIDFDGDWVSTNNWDNLKSKNDCKAVSYYSVVESETHYFILYTFFHPRDWTDIFFLYSLDQHENDLEGALHIIRKDGSQFGSLEGVVTVFHSDFYSYKPQGSSLSGGHENIDGTCDRENYDGSLRVLTTQEAKGHGMKTFPDFKPGGSDYVKYYPSLTISEYPSDDYDRHVKYKLVDIFETNGIWDRRFDTRFLINAKYFPNSFTNNGSANTPWNWDDGNDGASYTGEIANNPAKLTAHYFSNLGEFSRNYTYNPYTGVK
ncbi:hypothetical protein [Aureibacter tunicatorum]|uniref:Uncharacterized protein n=1 Tax=Aureibacter tunicatorum TaxID=866807 RepID=A0AAE3XS75_9BACT|nr:hypothetical protein [Aureibacter tunicatorum]MDR6241064.1 hypothetical protein [Aureibacter tunicatorum]BDD03842.1 hypothetical protein AUTU_13250 [Aureibacter tunicatorum]